MAWASVKGYIGYVVSSDGKVFDNRTQQEVIPYTFHGQQAVKLVDKDGQEAIEPLALLVLESFDTTYRPGWIIAFKDRDSTNCHIDNLMWLPREPS